MIYGMDPDEMTQEEFEKWDEERRTKNDMAYDLWKDTIAENKAAENGTHNQGKS